MSDRAPLILTLALACIAGGCTERVTAVRGGLYGIDGASGGYAHLAANNGSDMTVQEILESYRPSDPPLVPIEDEPLRYRDAEGDLHVECVSTRPLIYHLTEMLRRGEHDLIHEWLISDETKLRYREAFRDAKDAVDFLVTYERDVVNFFLLMPAGELTPGVRMTTHDGGVLRLRPELSVRYTDVRFSTLEVIIENGRCKLLRIY